MYRFRILEKAKKDIKDCDWLIFIDADMAVVDTVEPEDLFDESKPYIGVHHPCHFLKFPPHDKPPGAFETNPLSLAKISEEYDHSIYWQGCL